MLDQEELKAPCTHVGWHDLGRRKGAIFVLKLKSKTS